MPKKTVRRPTEDAALARVMKSMRLRDPCVLAYYDRHHRYPIIRDYVRDEFIDDEREGDAKELSKLVSERSKANSS